MKFASSFKVFGDITFSKYALLLVVNPLYYDWSHGREREIIWEQFILTFHRNNSQLYHILLWKSGVYLQAILV